MGIISLEKADNLYWLGRYSERVFTTLKVFYEYYDKMLDEDADAYKVFCRQLGLPDVYHTTERFTQDYLYDKSNPDSVSTSVNRAYDNAIVLREEIGTTALGYIQMALDTMKESKAYTERYMQHQKVMDHLYAFWGCVDDEVEDEENRNIMKTGRYVERLDLSLRLDLDYPHLDKAYRKLSNRVRRLRRPYNDARLYRLGQIMAKKENWKEEAGEALLCVNGLFEVDV
ncbi:MAG: alpha-E domain-containing protein [Lachnospiraceae bacterium]|nr:alpha-E domain-containing protein [Lachnospiraceae bacterium]